MRNHQLILCLILAWMCPLVLCADNYVILNQIMYDTPLNERVTNPPFSNGEYIELYNGGSSSVSLQGWRLKGEGQTENYYFPDTTIASQGFMVIAYRHSATPTFSLYDEFPTLPQGTDKPVLYQNVITLTNSGERITLYNALNEQVDQIYYDGTSHKTKPDRLSADNPDSIPGAQCVSLHRTWVEFDEDGRVVPGTSQWKTELVSLATCMLAEPSFSEHNLMDDQSLPVGENYILSVFPLDPTTRVTISDDGVSVSSGVRTQTAIQYYDGLGRPHEKIELEATPGRNDLVSTTQYQGLHRATHQWLPVPLHTEGQIQDIADVRTETQTFYGDNHPYHETLYENSALERVMGNKRPGGSWPSHPTAYAYSVNGNINVRVYSVLNDGKLKTTGADYDESFLFKYTSTDEDGKSVITYTDKLGRTIAEERADHKTYYVYDELGYLRFVLPHIDPSKLSNGEYDLNDSVLQAAAYCYRYDNRGNMIYKRLPGCEPQLMVYDQLGQLVLRQDGNQRPDNKWTMFAYDSIGRNLYTSEIVLSNPHNVLLTFYADKWQVEHYGSNGSNGVAGTGYGSSLLGTYNLTPLTFNYYDNYDFISKVPTAAVRPALRFAQEPGYGLQHEDATGMLTGTRIYNLSDNSYTTSAYYYDAQGRIVQRCTTREVAGHSVRTSTEYMFDGTIARQLTVHTMDGDIVRERYRYTYDHAGRAKQVFYMLDDGTEIALSAFSYDSVGHLVQNLLHNNRDTIRYSYDLRDMLTKTDNSHFSESLFYADTLPLPVQKCYNGNIAAACITHADSTYVFGYTYDAQNRLTESAQRRENQNKTSEWFNYDARGNITRLQRFNSERMIDDLHFSYQQNGNQLLSIRDDGEDADLYSTIEYHSAGLQVDTIMLYDANGNLISDADRGISVIKYNIHNLPDTIQFVNGNQIVNLYDAAGSKYKSIIYTNLATAANPCYDIAHYTSNTDSIEYKITEYNDNIETYYTSRDTTRRIFNATGYYADNTYYHYIKDHLGNNCAVVHSAADSVVQSTMYYASGVPMAESTGRDQQPYLYNGKEFVEAHGLNEYDSQARHYYATIMRTTTMDPMAEKYYHLSPYSWCGDNPVNAIDPTGMDSVYVNDQSERPADRGVAGETYTATVIVVQNGEVVGEYRGSTYPNSTSNSDNTTPYNTINEGDYPFNNEYGNKGGTEQGLNIVDEEGIRVVPGKNPKGEDVIIKYANVHSGESDKGNYNSRGSKACLTIHPDDAEAFFSHFVWTNDKKTTGTSTGRIFIKRNKNTKEEKK